MMTLALQACHVARCFSFCFALVVHFVTAVVSVFCLYRDVDVPKSEGDSACEFCWEDTVVSNSSKILGAHPL